VFLKIAVAAHLLAWGYPWERIHWEQSPPEGPGRFRADLYADGHSGLPSFWFECGDTGREKLGGVVARLPDFRVVHVMNVERFLRWWNGEDVVPSQVKDKRELKPLILQHRLETTVPSVEYWGVRETSASARILFAVRRGLNGPITYLDSGEGWSLSSIRYVSKRKDQFQALIPGLVGDDQWRGETSLWKD
jgi:hypothetical protein